ncbi:acid-sensing ion channel 1B-like [Branchiostoma floridae x Branchiostoma japonicum]
MVPFLPTEVRASGVSINDQLYLGAAFYIPTLVGDPEALNAYLNGVDWDSFGASTELLEDYAGYTRRNGFVLDSNNFTHVFTTYGNCWTFNGDKNSPLKQTTPGAGNGLKMTLDILTDEYTENPLTGYLEYGLVFQVHDQNEPPRPELVGTAVAPGSHTYASTFQTHESGTRTRSWGQCDPKKGQNYLEYYDTYTLPGCLLECRAKRVESCGCRPMYYPGTLDYCSPLNLSSCVLPTLATFLQENNEFDACGCTVPCEHTSYHTTVSYAGYPSPQAASYLETVFNVSRGYSSVNIVLLDVYYHELRSTTLEQFKAVTQSGLISDVGGQLGFFIGVSVITLFEFFEYLVMKFLVFACYSKMESETEKPDREQSAKENSSVPPENKGALATELQTMPKTQKGLAEIQVS